MSTPKTPISVVLIGIHAGIGAPIAEGLRPDFDVIHFIQTFPTAQAELPHVLRGEAPPTDPTNTVGSADYSRGGARAVLFGRGFSQAQAEELYAANKSFEGVAWIVGDDAKRPEGTGPPSGADKIMLGIFKEQLEKWVKDGEKGGLVLY
ncbi:hypothetical protein F4803DRAFT_215986 [Xylaria telfairii]|nr:hypothetical protein F4803DRAFT_215986 [Xylaria telfairii]